MAQLDWHECHPERLAKWAARALADGACLGFPSLAVRAATEAGQLAGQPSILVADLAGAIDWAPGLGEAGRRIARRLWPGAILATREGASRGLASRLPDDARRKVAPEGVVRLHAPTHPSLAAVLALSRIPLACSEAEQTVALQILDRTRTIGPAPVLEADGAAFIVHHAGASSEASLRERLARLVVFVCTGNTCRSPMAEALFKLRLSERLGCTPEELPSRGWVVISAGLAAMPGMAAAREAISVAGPLLEGHQSRPLTDELAMRADLLLGMTGSHVRALEGLPAMPLDPEGDIGDPVGQPLEAYRECAGRISICLDRLLAELLPA